MSLDLITQENQISNINIEKITISSETIDDNTPKYMKQAKILSISLYLTGIFAIVGALYRWGDGPIFNAPAGTDLQLYITDMLITAPATIISGIGFQKLKKWVVISGIFTSGILIYGSALVYVDVILNGAPYLLKLIIPPIFGISLSIAIMIWVKKYYTLL
ncbi:hypothetical protein [Candidatus Lokiarchaeum ossiferum]|uniref:hypothetical protein n=1 Tax=Candidatus Lokiarchaeum ossiferum TaxID=2951803 RepID=UPI00352F97B4